MIEPAFKPTSAVLDTQSQDLGQRGQGVPRAGKAKSDLLFLTLLACSFSLSVPWKSGSQGYTAAIAL